MISTIAKSSVDLAVFHVFKKGIKKDVASGHLSPAEAGDIACSMESLSGYADMQFVLYTHAFVTKSLCTLTHPIDLLLTNSLTTSWSCLDKRVDLQLLHLPAFMVLRYIHGIGDDIHP